MGAVIGMRDVTSDRKKLIDIGAAGPLAGIIVAIPVLVYGLARSKVGVIAGDGYQEGNSILYAVLKHAIKGEWLPQGSRDVAMHPTAWAGWVGLLVTMINLLPIGQLDGGHIATAYFGNRYDRFARAFHRALPLMAIGVFAWVMHVVRGETGARWNWRLGANVAVGAALFWMIWYVLLAILGRLSGGLDHPPVDDNSVACKPSSALLGGVHRVRRHLHAGADARGAEGGASRHDRASTRPGRRRAVAGNLRPSRRSIRPRPRSSPRARLRGTTSNATTSS